MHKELITRSDRLLKILDYLFGYQTSVYTSISFKSGTEQALHIDTPVFSTSPREFYFGVWIALEDADEQNGCLTALAGAHKKKYIDEFEFAEERVRDIDDINPNAVDLWPEFQKILVKRAKADGLTQISLEVEKGDVIIWHPQLPHGGSRVLNPTKTRYSTVFHVVPEGIPVYQADVFFNRDKKDISNIASFVYEKEFGRLFRVGVGTHFGGN